MPSLKVGDSSENIINENSHVKNHEIRPSPDEDSENQWNHNF